MKLYIYTLIRDKPGTYDPLKKYFDIQKSLIILKKLPYTDFGIGDFVIGTTLVTTLGETVCPRFAGTAMRIHFHLDELTGLMILRIIKQYI